MKSPRIEAPAGVWELARCLRYTPMNGGERVTVERALRELRRLAYPGEAEPTVEALSALADGADPAAAAALGEAAPRLLRHLRRALRAWQEPGRQALVRRKRGECMTLADGLSAAELSLAPQAAQRIRLSVERFCRAQGAAPADIPANLPALRPALAAASPETFGVRTLKARSNHVGAVIRAVRLVGGAAPLARTRDVAGLPEVWRTALDDAMATLPQHAHSQRAVLRRFAVQAEREGVLPDAVGADFVAAFCVVELSAHSEHHRVRLTQAFDAWNAIAASRGLSTLTSPATPRLRAEAVAWETLPASLRAEVEALLAAAAPVIDEDWGVLVDDEDAALGLDQMSPAATAGASLGAGTIRNYRDAVKRAWQAADPKPDRLLDLLTPGTFRGVVRLIRGKRRARLESGGESFDPKTKGAREFNLLKDLCTLARRASLDEARLAELADLRDSINPSIVRMTRTPDGRKRFVRTGRLIGPRHAAKLQAFRDPAAMARWLTAPRTLWSVAETERRRRGRILAEHVAIARSALFAQIEQRVAPLRRENLVPIRIEGETKHIFLPVGDTEGWLRIPAEETKTGTQIEVAIDLETTRMLKHYRDVYLPVARKLARAEASNPHLFPGAAPAVGDRSGFAKGDGFLSLGKANTTFRKHLRKYCGVDVNMHVMRHLSAKVILDEDPSAMPLVKEILAHKHLSTTQQYYAEVDQILAQRRYHELLDEGVKRALETLRFRIGPGAGLFRGGRRDA